MDNENGLIPSDSHEYHHTLVSQLHNLYIVKFDLNTRMIKNRFYF